MKHPGMLSLCFTLALTGCATQASRIKVPTMTVQEAWALREPQDKALNVAARMVRPAHPVATVVPVVSAPDIRLVYQRPWKDEAGHYHYGGWIALYVDAPKWVLPDGSVDPLESSVSPRRLPQ
jgi:hypothetical protein